MTYRRKPTTIEAVQWTGQNAMDLVGWSKGAFHPLDPEDTTDDPEITAELYVAANGAYLGIVTGEWVAHDALGYYPIKADVFEQNYEPVE